MVHKYIDMVAVFSSSQLKINSFLFSTWKKKNKTCGEAKYSNWNFYKDLLHKKHPL